MAENYPLPLLPPHPAGTSMCHFSELNCSWKRETRVRAGTNSVSGAQECNVNGDSLHVVELDLQVTTGGRKNL